MWIILNLLYLMMLPRNWNIFWSIGFWENVNRYFLFTYADFSTAPFHIVFPHSGIVVRTIYSHSDQLVFEKFYFTSFANFQWFFIISPLKRVWTFFKQSFIPFTKECLCQFPMVLKRSRKYQSFTGVKKTDGRWAPDKKWPEELI